jgi:hypothetical protein
MTLKMERRYSDTFSNCSEIGRAKMIRSYNSSAFDVEKLLAFQIFK